MRKELELWQSIAARLDRGENVIILVVAESSGSSPGRAGYKMAVAADGELYGSIGGGVMEVRLVEEARTHLSEPGAVATGFREQVHQRNSPNASGMICSGRQTVVFASLSPEHLDTVNAIIDGLKQRRANKFEISNSGFQIIESEQESPPFYFSRTDKTEFVYRERICQPEDLFIIGGGHCALALSELANKLGFRISIFDDRPELNTIAKNRFADEIRIVENYKKIGEHLPNGDDIYVVVMTLGYASDKDVIEGLIGRDFRYFGVLGSKAKMATLIKELKSEGVSSERLARVRTPIGIPINSRTPEEIAVSIAAEIIAVKNEAEVTSPRLPTTGRNR